MSDSGHHQVPLACDMTAIPSAEREAHHRVARHLAASATDICETTDGLSLRLSANDYDAAVQFIARECLCCPFLRFTLEVTPNQGPVRLHLQGPLGTAELLRIELHLPMSPG